MQEEIAIKVDHVSKYYRIGTQKEGSLRDTLGTLFKKSSVKGEEFRALDDVSFEIKKGDVVGIIGKNGAGKSTLLKILSQITKPTKGRVEINGRIASLLEVGTGFHPDLTGRENIYLNGTILGMTRQEVRDKFDEIVAFSGVEKFIDTPVKNYSSGMYVRLAFAVAAHLEPEILIIDEVLAVGDAEFQKKCLGKMGEVAGEGRTVIFVSHDLGAIANICNKAVLLVDGQIKMQGKIDEVIAKYLYNNYKTFCEWDINDLPGDKVVKLHKTQIINENKDLIYNASTSNKIGVLMEFEILKDNIKPVPNVHFATSTTYCFIIIGQEIVYNKGKYQSITWVPPQLLNNINYSIGVAMTTLENMNVHFWEKDILLLDVYENKSIRKMDYKGEIPGIIRVESDTEILKIQ